MAGSSINRGERWSLNGMTALVTGGTRGIGHSIVSDLAAFGAAVHTCSRTQTELNKCLQEWQSQGFQVTGSLCDVSSPPQREKLIQEVASTFNGKLNIYVNNVGINIRKPTIEYTAEEYSQIMTVNLDSSFHLCQLAYPLLKASEKGSIVFISSVAGVVSLGTGAVFAASKAAINQLTKNLACDWAKDNIRSNCVVPWATRTPVVEHADAHFLCYSKSNKNEPDNSQPPPEGDAQSQELLAQIAMLQTQKVRLTDFLDERSAYLAQFGEEAKAEFDKIGEDALKGLDEAGARITANIESQMLEFEESTELNRLEIEESENKIVEFEGQMEKDRNEGLFFKNLGQKAPVYKAKAKEEEEVEKIKDVNSESSGSKTRKNVYLFFIGLLTFGIVDSLASSSGADWKKVAVLGGILVVLFSLFINEQNKDNKKD